MHTLSTCCQSSQNPANASRVCVANNRNLCPYYFSYLFCGVIANGYLLDLLRQVGGFLGSFPDARRTQKRKETNNLYFFAFYATLFKSVRVALQRSESFSASATLPVAGDKGLGTGKSEWTIERAWDSVLQAS